MRPSVRHKPQDANQNYANECKMPWATHTTLARKPHNIALQFDGEFSKQSFNLSIGLPSRTKIATTAHWPRLRSSTFEQTLF